MLILAVQRTGEAEIWKFRRAGRSPVCAIYTDCVGNGFPVRVDGLVVDDDNWTTGVEEYIRLRVYLTVHGELEVMHKPKG